MTEYKKTYVDNDEMLIRLLAFPSCITENGVTVEAFSLYHKDEDYISVIREDFIETSVVDDIGANIKKWPEKDDQYFGYCTLLTDEVRKASTRLSVESKYTLSFPSHAGIVMLSPENVAYKNTTGFIIPPEMHLLQLTLRELANKRPIHATPIANILTQQDNNIQNK